jgi:hypothetical protein
LKRPCLEETLDNARKDIALGKHLTGHKKTLP